MRTEGALLSGEGEVRKFAFPLVPFRTMGSTMQGTKRPLEGSNGTGGGPSSRALGTTCTPPPSLRT